MLANSVSNVRQHFLRCNSRLWQRVLLVSQKVATVGWYNGKVVQRRQSQYPHVNL
jgi:hypothetical protein